jgi:hypothetical protein
MTVQRWGLPTEYGGVTFRSRLEARWAYFWDLVGVAWEYEPEGFQLPTGLYVPDFWLPSFGWFEVKPRLPEVREVQLANELARFTNEQTTVAWGPCFARWREGSALLTIAAGGDPDDGAGRGITWWRSVWHGCESHHAELTYLSPTFPPQICRTCGHLAHLPHWLLEAGDKAVAVQFSRESIRPVRLATR